MSFPRKQGGLKRTSNDNKYKFQKIFAIWDVKPKTESKRKITLQQPTNWVRVQSPLSNGKISFHLALLLGMSTVI